MADSKEKLFSEFPPVSTQQWMDKVNADLKGADFEKKLVWKTNEGFQVKPFYRSEDLEGLTITDSLPGEFPFVRGTKTNNEWLVRQDIVVDNVKQANEKALDVLNKGVNALGFKLSDNHINAETLETLLKGIVVECVELNFSCCIMKVVPLTNLVVDYVKNHQLDPQKVSGSIGFDPFKPTLTKGKLPTINAVEVLKSLMEATAQLPKFRVMAVNAYLFNNAGAYASQELGYGLAYGNAFLALADEAGIDPSVAAKKIKFNFGISSNYFMEIAKFRAARFLWSQIVGAYLGENDCTCRAKMHLHASTSEWNQSIYDAYVNMLRSQTETMSAALAGVDSITVVPFDAAFQASSDFSERIARNQQLLLKEETHFDKIVDASAGSYYIENLTNALIEEGWKIFLTIDDKGGFYENLANGYIQNQINATGEKRLSAVSSRKEVLLGTNQYPNFNESAVEKVKDILPTLLSNGANCTCSCATGQLAKLNFVHGSAQFDALRLATETSGKRPKVFMLTIGSLSMRLTRAQFSSNFFGCAGYEIIDNLGFETAAQGVNAAREAGADIIVVCSSDEEYAELAPQVQQAIGTGNEILVVAGAPECTEELKAQGITNFINVRSNVLQTLQAFSNQLGIL